MASVEERVIDIVAEQLGVSKDQITRETSLRQRSGCRLAGHRRTGDGTRRRVRHQHSRRRGREDPDRRSGDRAHREGSREQEHQSGERLMKRRVVVTGSGCGHLAELQGRGPLDATLQRRERGSHDRALRHVAVPFPLRRRDPRLVDRRLHARARKRSGSIASPSSRWSARSTRCATRASTSPRKTPSAAA